MKVDSKKKQCRRPHVMNNSRSVRMAEVHTWYGGERYIDARSLREQIKNTSLQKCSRRFEYWHYFFALILRVLAIFEASAQPILPIHTVLLRLIQRTLPVYRRILSLECSRYWLYSKYFGILYCSYCRVLELFQLYVLLVYPIPAGFQDFIPRGAVL